MTHHQWCDGCGTRMIEQPAVRHIHDERTYEFHTYECYLAHRARLDLIEVGAR